MKLVKPADYPALSLAPWEALQKFKTLLGDLSPRVALQIGRGEKIPVGNGLYRERITYQVDKNEVVAAIFFSHDTPRPAVLAIHAHGGGDNFPRGKEGCTQVNELVANYAYQIARAGFSVLTPDALCFGERAFTEGYSREFFSEILAAMELSARGGSLGAKSIFDNMRAIDVLEALEEADCRSLGVIGHSGGSIQGYMLTACDDRIQTGIFLQSFITLRHQFYQYGLCHCLYPYIPGMVASGMDFDQIVASIVPRNIFLGWGELDEGTPRAMQEAFSDAIRREKKKCGDPDCFELFISPKGHEITSEMLRAAIDFLTQKTTSSN